MKRLIGAAIALALSATPSVADRYGDAETAHLLGRYDTARRLLLPLARKGDKRAQYLLGRQYQLGQGVAKDPVKAYVWYSRAAKQGHAEAGLFKHLLVSKWKMSPAQVTKAEAILSGKKPTVVASVKPTATATTKSTVPAPRGKDTTTVKKAPTGDTTDDFGPVGPDPRGRPRDDETRESKNVPPEKDPPEKAPAAKDPGDKKPVAKDPPRKAPVDRPSPRSTAKIVPKSTGPTEPTDDDILRREREADRKAGAEAEARRRQEAAERQEIETRRRAEAFRREHEQESRAPYIPEEDSPPLVERWEAAPPVVPYGNRRYYPRNFRPYYAPPARVYAPRAYPWGVYRTRPRGAWQNRYRNNWRWQRRAWRRGYNQRGYNRRR